MLTGAKLRLRNRVARLVVWTALAIFVARAVGERQGWTTSRFNAEILLLPIAFVLIVQHTWPRCPRCHRALRNASTLLPLCANCLQRFDEPEVTAEEAQTRLQMRLREADPALADMVERREGELKELRGVAGYDPQAAQALAKMLQERIDNLEAYTGDLRTGAIGPVDAQ